MLLILCLFVFILIVNCICVEIVFFLRFVSFFLILIRVRNEGCSVLFLFVDGLDFMFNYFFRIFFMIFFGVV